MRTIKPTTQFKKDYKREAKGKHRTYLDGELKDVLATLANDIGLAPRYADHPMIGQWKNHRDCHIRSDLVLIYRLPDDLTLSLVRLGSHSELGI
jgi:mRNA interferase YafQ